jgi:hypothetical protein
MMTQALTELVASLSPEEQAAVVDFIRFFRGERQQPDPSPFLSAIDEFMAQHPELCAGSPSDPLSVPG